jgi:tubulin-specific chaperone A
MYKKETEEQQQRVDKYIADAADEWDIKNQVCRFALGT